MGPFIFISLLFVLFIWINNSKLQQFLLIIALLVYVGVEIQLNDNVRKASTHGNTKHGWYSEKNNTEKFLVNAWVYGFPIGTAIVMGSLFGKKEDDA